MTSWVAWAAWLSGDLQWLGYHWLIGRASSVLSHNVRKLSFFWAMTHVRETTQVDQGSDKQSVKVTSLFRQSRSTSWRSCELDWQKTKQVLKSRDLQVFWPENACDMFTNCHEKLAKFPEGKHFERLSVVYSKRWNHQAFEFRYHCKFALFYLKRVGNKNNNRNKNMYKIIFDFLNGPLCPYIRNLVRDHLKNLLIKLKFLHIAVYFYFQNPWGDLIWGHIKCRWCCKEQVDRCSAVLHMWWDLCTSAMKFWVLRDRSLIMWMWPWFMLQMTTGNPGNAGNQWGSARGHYPAYVHVFRGFLVIK